MITPLLTITGDLISFYLLALIMVLGALGVVLSRKPVYSALSLATVMLCLAIQYAVLEAPFLFAAQIIVYTGAILMLFLFVLMLVGVDSAESVVETIKGQRLFAGLALLGLVTLLFFAVGNAVTTPGRGLVQANSGGNVQGIAALLFHDYVFAFEAAAALLITAALAAMVLTYRERLVPRKSQPSLAKIRLQRYAEYGEHPGPLPPPGVFARHNAVDTPALLPDGSIEPKSINAVLRARAQIDNAPALARAHDRTRAAIAGDGSNQDLLQPNESQSDSHLPVVPDPADPNAPAKAEGDR